MSSAQDTSWIFFTPGKASAACRRTRGHLSIEGQKQLSWALDTPWKPSWPLENSSHQVTENTTVAQLKESGVGLPAVASCPPPPAHTKPSIFTHTTRLLCPWDFPGKKTGGGCYLLLQGIFPIQESNPHLLHLFHCRQILYALSYWRSSSHTHCVAQIYSGPHCWEAARQVLW